MDPISAIGAGVGLIGTIGSLFGNARANRRLEQLIKQNPTYKENPIARERMALAQQLLNARMPGAAALERNIYTNQAGTLDQIQRNATDSSQALALAAGVQGQTNQAFQNLGVQEAQDYYNRLNNLGSAQQGVIAEGDKVYQDQVRRFQDLAQIRGAQNANRQNSWGTVSNLGFGLMNYGLAAGGGLGKAGGAGQQSSGGMNPLSMMGGVMGLPIF